MTSGKSIIQDGRNKTFDGQARTFTNTYSRTLTDTHTDTQTHVLTIQPHALTQAQRNSNVLRLTHRDARTPTLPRKYSPKHMYARANMRAEITRAHAMTHPRTETFIDAQKRVLTNTPTYINARLHALTSSQAQAHLSTC